MKKQELLALADKAAVQATALRREIHMNPELSGKEYDTARLVVAELDRLGIENKQWDNYTGVVGLIKGAQPGPVIALRADMDALPIVEERTELDFCSKNHGVMHACGHDIHTSILLGAAAVLKELAPRLCGSVKLLFQPSEEAGNEGAAKMVALGCMEDPHVDRVFGIHVCDARQWGYLGTKAGAINSASDHFAVTVTGISSHGTKPHKGVDAIFTACQMINNLYVMPSRRLSALDTVSLNVGTISGGTADNIICDKVSFGISLRTVDKAVREFMHREIIDMLESTARLNHATVEIAVESGAKSQFNDIHSVETIRNVSDLLYGKGAYTDNEYPSMGSEDFSEYCDYGENGTLGAMWELGVSNSEKGWTAALHNSRFCPDERSIPIGIAMQAGIVYSYIGQDELGE